MLNWLQIRGREKGSSTKVRCPGKRYLPVYTPWFTLQLSRRPSSAWNKTKEQCQKLGVPPKHDTSLAKKNQTCRYYLTTVLAVTTVRQLCSLPLKQHRIRKLVPYKRALEMHFNSSRTKVLTNTLMITINLFRYLIFHCNFHVANFGRWGRSYRKGKTVKDVICAALLCFGSCRLV